jgi:hypothetical protein
MCQKTKPARAFRDAGLHVDRRVKISRFLPELLRRCHLTGIALQNCQPADRVRQIERRSSRLAAIKTQSFVIAGFGQFRVSRFPANVSHMPHGVRQSQRVALRAVQPGRFFIVLEGRVGAMLISLNLSQSGERPRQFRSDPGRATEIDSLDQVPLGIVKSMLSSSLKRLPQKFVG